MDITNSVHVNIKWYNTSDSIQIYNFAPSGVDINAIYADGWSHKIKALELRFRYNSDIPTCSKVWICPRGELHEAIRAV